MSIAFKKKALTAPPDSDHVSFGHNVSGRLRIRSFGGVERDLLPVIDAREFGEFGVGNDRAVIQSAIDYALYASTSIEVPALAKRVRLPAMRLTTDDTIHLGYGTDFRTVILEGDGYKYPNDLLGGTIIIPTFSDRPVINIQGGRGSYVRNLGISGLLETYILANNLANDAPVIDDIIAANWNDPALAATQDARYAPYAAITIDAYSGNRPATSYPDVTYPSFLGVVAQYNKNFSSDTTIENVYIRGFTVAVANQPCDDDGNGDFTTIRDCYFSRCKWGLSVGNSQSRSVHVQCLVATEIFTLFTNRVHGRQIGKFGGTIIDLSAFHIINIIDFNGFYPFPVTFINLYVEYLWAIGVYDSTSSQEKGLIFQGCEFAFTAQGDATRGVPATILSGGARYANLRFVCCTFKNFPSVVSLRHPSAQFDGCLAYPETYPTLTYAQFAFNVLAGGLVLPPLGKLHSHRLISHRYFDLDTGVGTSVPITTGNIQTIATRNVCASLYANQVQAGSDPSSPPINMPAIGNNTQGKATLASCSLSDKTLTFAFSSRGERVFYYSGPLPGDVVYDYDTGSVFFVRSRSGLTVIAELQNNYRSDGAGGFDTITPFSTTVGTLYFINSRVYTPNHYLRGDMTAGNAVITNCARDDDVADYDAQIAVDDWVYVVETSDRWTTATNSKITARDQAAGTITLNSGAAVRAATRKRLALFIRQPPANV